MIADLHTHSENSSDAENSVIQMCESAVGKGLDCFAVTDHCEIGTYIEENYEKLLEQSYFDVEKARSVYSGQIDLLAGVELGFSKADPETALKVVQAYPYDVVLGSIHNISDMEDFYFLDYHQLDVPQLISRYLDELYEMTVWGQFDVLAHLTYPLRYINGVHGLNIRILDFQDKVERILKEIIKKGIALEINTSGLREPYGTTLPELDCLELYKELGGERITIGSDAHTAENVGCNIADGLKIARKAGFTHGCLFRMRKPLFYRIEI